MVPPRKRKQPRKFVGAEEHARNRTYGRKWRETRRKVLARDRFECQIKSPVCVGRADQVDHVTPARQTGPVFDPGVLRASCRPCNNYVAAHPEWRPSPSTATLGPVSGPTSTAKFPPRGITSCPHRHPDGTWCVGSGDLTHWSQWYLGSPDDPPDDWTQLGAEDDDPPDAATGVIV
jgi:hypothetical protein